MATSYQDVYSRFLGKVTDFDLSAMTDTNLQTNLLTFLKGAIPKFVLCKTDLSQRDDTSGQFTNTLSELEEEILASYMVVEWINPRIQNTMLLKPVMSDGDFKIFSQANQLKELRSLKASLQSEIAQLVKDYTYSTGNLSGFSSDTSKQDAEPATTWSWNNKDWVL